MSYHCVHFIAYASISSVILFSLLVCKKKDFREFSAKSSTSVALSFKFNVLMFNGKQFKSRVYDLQTPMTFLCTTEKLDCSPYS